MVVKMKRLLFIEYYKLFRNKKNWLLILACIVLFLFIGIQNMSLDRQYMEHRLDYLEDEADSAMLMRDDLEKKMTGLDKSSKEWEQLKEEYDYWAWETEASRLLSGYYHNVNTVYGEDQKIAELSIQRNQKLIDAIHKEYTGMLYQFSTPQREVEESQKEIYIMQKLLDNNKEELKENPSLSFLYSSPYEMNGFNYLARAFDGILYIFVIMLLYLFISDCYTKEMEQGSYKFYMTTPYKRTTIILAKIITVVSFSLFLLGLSLGIGFLVFSFLNGIGDIQYPNIIGKNLTTPCGKYLIKLGAMVTISIITLIVSFFYFSLYTKKQTTLIAIGSCILLCVYFIYALFGLSNVHIVELPFISQIYVSKLLQQKNNLIGIGAVNIILIVCFIKLSVSRFSKLDLKDG